MKRFCILLASVAMFAGDKRPIIPGRSSNDNVALEAVLVMTKEEVKSKLGADLPDGFILLDVTLSPKNGQTVKIDRDDFVLVSGKDGQRSKPFAPTEIAGAGAMQISTGYQNVGVQAQRRREPWGGIGGRMPGGMPGNGGGVGNTASTESAQIKDIEEKGGDAALLATLKEKILPEKEVTEPVSGQLYFLFDGKLKPKDLELYYKAPGGRLNVVFVRK